MKRLAPLTLALLLLVGCRPAPGTAPSQPLAVPPVDMATPAPSRPNPFVGIVKRFPAPSDGRSIDTLESASAKNPTDAKALKALGLAYYNAGGFEPAIATLEKAHKADLEESEAYFYLGAALLGSGEVERGVETLREVVDAPSPTGAIAARAHLLLADALYLDAGEASAARPEYTEALKFPETMGEAALALGTIEAQAGKKAEAKAFFEKAVAALKPGERRSRAYASLGRLAGETRDTAGAKGWYEKALKDDPNNAWAAQALKK